MTLERSLFDESGPTAEAAADARTDADMQAWRLISHDAVKRWISSWGTDKPLPNRRLATKLRKIVWTEEAIAHLEAIVAYISAFNPSAAVGDKLLAVADSLVEFSERGRTAIRCRLLGTFKFIALM